MSGLQEILNKCKAAIWSVTPWIGFISTSSWKLICSAIDEVAIIHFTDTGEMSELQEILEKCKAAIWSVAPRIGFISTSSWKLICSAIDEVAIIPKSAESAKTVPMAMLRDAWNNGEICTNEYQNKKLLEIAARYGYAVTESGKEEGR